MNAILPFVRQACADRRESTRLCTCTAERACRTVHADALLMLPCGVVHPRDELVMAGRPGAYMVRNVDGWSVGPLTAFGGLARDPSITD